MQPSNERAGRLKAFIFDMDGLMVDSEPLSRQAWEDVLAPYGVTLEDKIYIQVIGWRLDATSVYIQDKYNLPISPNQLGQVKKQRLTELRQSKGVQPMPGLERLLGTVEQRGIPWAVATSNHRLTAEENLINLGLIQRCQAIAAGDEVSQGKPSPDLYLLAAQRLGIEPRFCLALEDSLPGIRSALAAGMVTLAVPGGHGHRDEFEMANYVFSSLDTVTDHFDQLVSSAV